MKKGSVEKGPVEKGDEAVLDVNIVQWAGSVDCQTDVDSKAFKGKGTLLELRQLVDRLAEIEAKMVNLIEVTKGAAQACGAYMALHRRKTTGWVNLRWREAGGSQRHMRTEDLAKKVAEQSEAVRRWVRSASEEAERLNDAHYRVRNEIRVIRKFIERKKVHMLPRIS